MSGCREVSTPRAHALPEWSPVRCARSLNVATRMRAILRGSTLVRRRDPSTRGCVEVWRNLGGWTLASLSGLWRQVFELMVEGGRFELPCALRRGGFQVPCSPGTIRHHRMPLARKSGSSRTSTRSSDRWCPMVSDSSGTVWPNQTGADAFDICWAGILHPVLPPRGLRAMSGMASCALRCDVRVLAYYKTSNPTARDSPTVACAASMGQLVEGNGILNVKAVVAGTFSVIETQSQLASLQPANRSARPELPPRGYSGSRATVCSGSHQKTSPSAFGLAADWYP